MNNNFNNGNKNPLNDIKTIDDVMKLCRKLDPILAKIGDIAISIPLFRNRILIQVCAVLCTLGMIWQALWVPVLFVLNIIGAGIGITSLLSPVGVIFGLLQIGICSVLFSSFMKDPQSDLCFRGLGGWSKLYVAMSMGGYVLSGIFDCMTKYHVSSIPRLIFSLVLSLVAMYVSAFYARYYIDAVMYNNTLYESDVRNQNDNFTYDNTQNIYNDDDDNEGWN